MATTSTDRPRLVEVLLARHGRTFSSEAGIRLGRATPAPLFRLLCLSLLISARIRADVAVAACRALADAGWTTPDKLAASTWEDRTRVLNRSGYARYDESTSRYLADTTGVLLDRYDGDLRQLREEADGDLDTLRDGLQRFKGIGGVGADVFVREVQAVWEEYRPFVDDRTLGVAERLDLPPDPQALLDLAPDPSTFVRLVAALVRAGLDDDLDELITATHD